jgi:hypothetical protein
LRQAALGQTGVAATPLFGTAGSRHDAIMLAIPSNRHGEWLAIDEIIA